MSKDKTIPKRARKNPDGAPAKRGRKKSEKKSYGILMREKQDKNKKRTYWEEREEGLERTLCAIERCKERDRQALAEGRYITRQIGRATYTGTPEAIAKIERMQNL
ncbi:MAG: hypothetical protein Q4A64_08810 [Porphyromonadaceae bacterium]|nr:hypothetical protein [Porphyromonadaceae bacterium]